MSQIKPTHKAIRAYYAALRTYAEQHAEHEGAIRSAFLNLLAEKAKPHGWTLIPELGQKVRGKNIYPDGTLRDGNSLPRGFWEAKDTNDDLDKEVRLKIDKDFPTTTSRSQTPVWERAPRNSVSFAGETKQSFWELRSQTGVWERGERLSDDQHHFRGHSPSHCLAGRPRGAARRSDAAAAVGRSAEPVLR